ncbi:MAG: hypothetical protein Cons2KO_32850 [Congregibacter sp.]
MTTHPHGFLPILVLACALAAGSRADNALDAREIVSRAQAAAGGEVWRDAQSLVLRGYATFFANGAMQRATAADSYQMWRVFPRESRDAHTANGQVAFHAQQGENTVFHISFDGLHSYDQNGRIEDAAASEQWKSNFGFGIFRFALDEGFTLHRLADDSVDGHPCHFVKVIDPTERSTLFAIDRNSYNIRMVGFDTPRGFHHRIYDSFYSNDDGFLQPESVRLYYDGVKTADIRWTQFELNSDIDPQVFVIEAATP